jgi:hypothetical protein
MSNNVTSINLFDKKKIKKINIKYKQIYDAIEYVEDKYWKTIFMELSYGKRPNKLIIDDTKIFIKNKKKIITYNYYIKTPQEIATELKDLLSNELNIFSSNDMKNNNVNINKQLNNFLDTSHENSWKKIKNKKMKYMLILNYTINKKKEWNMNWTQTRDFYAEIDNSLNLYKTHTSNDIKMENNIISNIADINLINGVIVNTRNNNIINELDIASDTEEPVVSDGWIKYIKNLSDDC